MLANVLFREMSICSGSAGRTLGETSGRNTGCRAYKNMMVPNTTRNLVISFGRSSTPLFSNLYQLAFRSVCVLLPSDCLSRALVFDVFVLFPHWFVFTLNSPRTCRILCHKSKGHKLSHKMLRIKCCAVIFWAGTS